jgi:hypothetical protein
MAVNITYRSDTQTVPPNTSVKGSPLTNAEIDGNFKSVKDSIESLEVSITQIETTPGPEGPPGPTGPAGPTIYPSAGFAISTGTAWGVSKSFIPSGDVVGTTQAQTLTNKTLTSPILNSPNLSSAILNSGYTESVFTISTTTPALSPSNGSIQTWVLSANSSPTIGTWSDGQSITLMIDDGSSRLITWPTISWVGGSPPVLSTTGFTIIVLWRVSSVMYGLSIGNT